MLAFLLVAVAASAQTAPNWTRQIPQNFPPPRSSHAMTYDSVHDQTALYGGTDDLGGVIADTWTWGAGAPPPLPPFIGSVVSASSYGGFAAVSPGSFVEIYGSNLAPDTRGWTESDFTGNQAPTSLDGVAVSVAGRSVFVNYIVANPGQVGEFAAGNSQLVASLEILFGETSGTLAYYGLSPGLVGVYQFTVMVPAIPANDLVPLTFKLAGVQGTQILYTAVHQ